MIASEDFKRTLAQLAGAVTVITTCDAQGQPWGFTATAFCSLSLHPPLVLCCLSYDADCYQAFSERRAFAVNMLTEQQRHLAQRFATKGRAKYQETQFTTGALGLPLLPGVLVTLECTLHTTYAGGDHSILIGQVEHSAMGSDASARPLIYYAQTYGSFVALPALLPELNARQETQASSVSPFATKREANS